MACPAGSLPSGALSMTAQSSAASERSPGRIPVSATGPRDDGASRRASGPASYQEYLGRRYFAPFDGLRAESMIPP